MSPSYALYKQRGSEKRSEKVENQLLLECVLKMQDDLGKQIFDVLREYYVSKH